MDVFVTAIHNKRIVNITFFSKEKGILSRKCIPLDFGPSNRAKDNRDKYHFIDLEGQNGKHTLSISEDKLIGIMITDYSFNPVDYIKWRPCWYIERDWEVNI